MDRGAWRAKVHGTARVRHDLVTKPSPMNPKLDNKMKPMPTYILEKTQNNKDKKNLLKENLKNLQIMQQGILKK